MNQSYPVPPPELVAQWIKECDNPQEPRWQEYEQDIATLAAQWGADMELEACLDWLDDTDCEDPQEVAQHLRAARRPKPPSLKEQALRDLDALAKDLERNGMGFGTAMIRRALEAL